MMPAARLFREVARYKVMLQWQAPRTWGARNLPHAGRFYTWALFDSPERKVWTHAEPTGNLGRDGIEIVELAIIVAADDPHVPSIEPGEPFELSPGVRGLMVAAHGRVLERLSESN